MCNFCVYFPHPTSGCPSSSILTFCLYTFFFFFSSRRRHTRCSRDWSSDVCFFFSSRRRHTRCSRHWSSDVCSSDLLHLAEAMGIGVTDDEQLVPALQAHLGAAAQVAHHAGDGMNVDDGRTVNLPEGGRIELLAKLLDGLADQRFLRGGDHAGVLAVGLEITHVVPGDDAHRRAVRRVDPAQETALRRG